MNPLRFIDFATSSLPQKTILARRPGLLPTLRGGALLCLPVMLAASFIAAPLNAGTLDSLDQVSQSQFKILAENIGAATHYKALSPPEPLGLIGFDVAIELSATDIDEGIFDLASDGDFELSRFLLPRLHVHKGLPFGIDIGAFLTAIPDTDFRAMGAEVRYAILEGSTITPALGVRATYSLISGVDVLDVKNAGLELAVSKGFAMLTPYAGIGVVRTIATPNGIAGLDEETVDLTKLTVGLNVNLGINFGIEVDQTGDYRTYSIKTGIRF